MTQYPKIVLKPAKEAALKRFHPWLFSGAIMKIETPASEGDIVEVYSSRMEYLGTGHYLDGSIAVKICSFKKREIGPDFWREKLKSAYHLRQRLGLTENQQTNAYRLVFSEGDGLPGLFIDYYDGSVVIQTHHTGMHRIKPVLTEILKDIYGERLVSVYDKSDESINQSINPPGDKFLFGESGPIEILETGHRFKVDFILGQKTGFFLDQRNNRMFAQFYAKDKKVLNAFCYSGAFSVSASKGGAAMVHSVDSSKQAIEWTEENVTLNGIEKASHKSFVAEVKKYLTHTEETYDMIILDPPAFARHHHISHNALQAYIHINTQAMKKLTPGGLLFTFSCSQPISREMFQSAMVTAGLQAGRKVSILHHLTQGPDHPVSLYHPEGAYLKGLILFVQ